jgi:NAD(P)-dependent dehydrogenase (short-subunit alcohol dehydrogenase family)
VLNAATILPLGPTIEISVNFLEETFRNNFFGYVSIIQEFAKASSLFGYRLRIIWVGTGATEQIIPGWYAYSASKAALKSYLLFISKENPAISVETFEPGIFQSKIQEELILFHSGQNQNSQKLPSPEISASILAKIILD